MITISRFAIALVLSYTMAVCPYAIGQSSPVTAPGFIASAPDSGKEIQLILPPDTRTREAIDAALPIVKKVLAIHQCVKTLDGMLQLNFWAVPGVNFRGSFNSVYPNSTWYMKYHDRNKCVSVRAIDNWAMPALNALKFRVVYFAEDSGETVNFAYLLKKIDDGSWKLAEVKNN